MNQEQELLEIWDWHEAAPTGTAVERGMAHRQGIAHEGVHLWIGRWEGSEFQVLFQHRSPEKAVYPDCLDTTVGGHVPFGLSDNKLEKEAQEEIGITPDRNRLLDLGYFRYEEKGEGIHHREFQHIFILEDNRPLEEYSFTDNEVIALCAVPLERFTTLLEKDTSFSVSCYDGKKATARRLTRDDFHPLFFADMMRPYLSIVIRALEELAASKPVTARFSTLGQLKVSHGL